MRTIYYKDAVAAAESIDKINREYPDGPTNETAKLAKCIRDGLTLDVLLGALHIREVRARVDRHVTIDGNKLPKQGTSYLSNGGMVRWRKYGNALQYIEYQMDPNTAEHVSYAMQRVMSVKLPNRKGMKPSFREGKKREPFRRKEGFSIAQAFTDAGL